MELKPWDNFASSFWSLCPKTSPLLAPIPIRERKHQECRHMGTHNHPVSQCSQRAPASKENGGGGARSREAGRTMLRFAEGLRRVLLVAEVITPQTTVERSQYLQSMPLISSNPKDARGFHLCRHSNTPSYSNTGKCWFSKLVKFSKKFLLV